MIDHQRCIFTYLKAWLVYVDGALKVTKTIGAETPIAEEGVTPILTMVR